MFGWPLDEERSFAVRAQALGVRYAKGMRVEGINISGGRRIAVTVFRASTGPGQ